MFRIMSRIAAAAVVLMVSPSSPSRAQARPLNDQPRPSPGHVLVPGRLSWLTGLRRAAARSPCSRTTRRISLRCSGGGGILQPNTGSCIDPQGGGPRCHSDPLTC